MKTKTVSLAVAAALLAMPFASQALADRPATPSERRHVGEVLHGHGFVSWGKIERDDGKWEVDNAVTQSGKVYDVEIVGNRIVDADPE